MKYKGQVVFEKIAMSTFDRVPKLYQNNEACFMFINEGQFSVRTPDEFAQLCPMSISSFKRKFKEKFNESPKKYLGKMKLEKFVKMLESKDIRISDIAYDGGLDTISTFNRSFKNHYAKSPSAYRLTQTA